MKNVNSKSTEEENRMESMTRELLSFLMLDLNIHAFNTFVMYERWSNDDIDFMFGRFVLYVFVCLCVHFTPFYSFKFNETTTSNVPPARRNEAHKSKSK